MKRISFIIVSVLLIVIAGCNKNPTPTKPMPPEMLTYMDSMLASIGIGSYTDVLTGRLEGNFEIFAHYAPYESNCATFTVNTQLGGNVANDTSRTTAIDAGDLWINNLVVEPDDVSKRYEIYYGRPEYNTQLQKLNTIYGNTNLVRLIKDGDTIFSENIYIPAPIVMKGYNCTTLKMAGDPVGVGTTINWNPDHNNRNGIIVQFRAKDASGVERYTYKIASDNGQYRILNSDLNLYPKEKNPIGINITLIRGNFFFTIGTDGRKYNFTVSTTCDYYFDIK